jgi:hypothetical protein
VPLLLLLLHRLGWLPHLPTWCWAPKAEIRTRHFLQGTNMWA